MKVLVLLYPIEVIIWLTICFFVWRKTFNKVFFLTVLLFISTGLFLYHSEPKDFGTWDLLDEDPIQTIILFPTSSLQKVNLIKRDTIIVDLETKKQIIDHLKHSQFILANHPDRIWEVGLKLDSDINTYEFQVFKTSNQGTLVIKGYREYQNNALGELFEKRFMPNKN